MCLNDNCADSKVSIQDEDIGIRFWLDTFRNVSFYLTPGVRFFQEMHPMCNSTPSVHQSPFGAEALSFAIGMLGIDVCDCPAWEFSMPSDCKQRPAEWL